MPVPLVPYIQYFDSNGIPRAGGKVYTYAAGTTTPKATYTTALGNIQAANPITLNSAGMPDHGSGNVGMIWIQGSYDFVVTNADDTDPITVPNETSFNTIAPASASYFQTWSGDGTTTFFATSQPLGTDENAILATVDNGLQNFVTNGDFATDTVWTKGAGWTIGAGVATAGPTISTAISQTANATIMAGQSYNVTYTVTRTAGTITPSIGGTAGTARSLSGTYTETIIAGATQDISFATAGFTGTLDNVSATLTDGKGRQVVYPTEFTLTNSGITFAVAPKAGTNNVAAWAFSSLVAAASASAAAAEAFADAANVSAVNAAASATSLLGTSASSVLIATGSQNFATQTGKNFATGEFITISSNAGPSNYMFGHVTSYATLTGALVVNVTDTGGSGTFSDWNIAVSGIKGPSGTTSPSNGTVTYPTLAASIIASSADIAAGTASKIPNATNLLAYIQANVTTPWVAYTPGTMQGFGTVSASYFKTRRVGQNLEISGKFTTTTPTAAECRISFGFNGTDANVTSSATLLPSGTNVAGPMSSTNAGSGFNVQTLIEPSVSYLTVGLQSAGAGSLSKVNGNIAFATGNLISFQASIPINGW